ncbi:hypothetical protein PC9H_005710 [Pleurotus ostreatus]|uniref:Uncharacterized protein n=1 Tax=Pleurotus ostreatus TaxID=5322 RepID=A0A8H6ZXL9_PLEOS|nr:uncharacterized protein PC9H_005710 [Pleurotus ostreatus]KAF7433745.1 hypothetical protein PC9H_005710 [Pleurotus ostreatus]
MSSSQSVIAEDSSSSTLIPPPDISPTVTPPFPSDADIIGGPSIPIPFFPSTAPSEVPTSPSASNPPASRTSSLISTPLLTSEQRKATGVAQVQSPFSSR